LALVALSILNLLTCMNASKTYTLFHHPTRPQQKPFQVTTSTTKKTAEDDSWIVKSRNARLVYTDMSLPEHKKSSTAYDSDDSDASHDNDYKTPLKSLQKTLSPVSRYITPKQIWDSVLSRTSGFSKILSEFSNEDGEGPERASKAKEVGDGMKRLTWILRVWDPPTHNLVFLYWFSPPCAMLLLSSPLSLINFISVLLINAMVQIVLFTSFFP
jgi:hypothetical protein